MGLDYSDLSLLVLKMQRPAEWPDPPQTREVPIAPGVYMLAREGRVELEIPTFLIMGRRMTCPVWKTISEIHEECWLPELNINAPTPKAKPTDIPPEGILRRG